MEIISIHEAFIRRSAQINLPFVLKGSYVTRQYFDNLDDRIPADLDWVYTNKLADDKAAAEVFNEWLTAVTELDLHDGIKYAKFEGDQYWERIDYAMADDFPTLNIQLWCIRENISDEYNEFTLDISFNLNMKYSPIPLMYRPLLGDPFIVPQTVPLFMQVAWKIHQTLVRPRFKDLFDLIHLTKHMTFDKNNCMRVLIDECNAGNVSISKLRTFFTYQIHNLFPQNSIQGNWDYWRHRSVKSWGSNDYSLGYYDKARYITDISKIPTKLSVFLEEFKNALQKSGLTINLLNSFEKLVKNNK